MTRFGDDDRDDKSEDGEDRLGGDDRHGRSTQLDQYIRQLDVWRARGAPSGRSFLWAHHQDPQAAADQPGYGWLDEEAALLASAWD